MQNIQQPFEEFLRLLEKNNVRYMIIGGYAVAYHGYPRFTKDMDIFYKNDPDNIRRIIKALCSFGFNPNDFQTELFAEKGNIIKFGIEPVRIDLLNDIPGLDFDEAEKNVIQDNYASIQVKFISKPDLVKNKTAANRLQDQLDIQKLE